MAKFDGIKGQELLAWKKTRTKSHYSKTTDSFF